MFVGTALKGETESTSGEAVRSSDVGLAVDSAAAGTDAGVGRHGREQHRGCRKAGHRRLHSFLLKVTSLVSPYINGLGRGFDSSPFETIEIDCRHAGLDIWATGGEAVRSSILAHGQVLQTPSMQVFPGLHCPFWAERRCRR